MDNTNVPPQIPGFTTPLRVFGTSRAGVKESVIWSCALGLLGLGLFIGGIIGISRSANATPGIIATVAGVAILLLALVFALNVVWLKGRRIWLFPEGIVDSFRGRYKTCRWDEIEEVVYWTTINDLAMRKADGQQVDFGFGTIESAGELAQAVMENTKAALAQRLINRILSGETVSFGRLDADRSGITIHYKAHKSRNPKSFYQGPWPRGDRRTNLAKSSGKDKLKLGWHEIQGVEEDGECDVFIRASDLIPTFSCPGDLPKSLFHKWGFAYNFVWDANLIRAI